jgi:hypothetical protein
MNQDLINKIIEYGTQAPSGDNSQPWKFVVTNKFEIKLYNLSEKDNPILNVHEGGSLVSHGAVILNIKIAADYFGYKTSVAYLPDSLDKDLVAILSFEKNSNDNHRYKLNLIESIMKRCTNRNHYDKNLPINTIEDLLKIIERTDLKVEIFTDQKDKDLIASSICISEEIILQTKELHELLFADVAWTKKEELIKKHGLFVKTLEFNPVQLFGFWLCRKWKTISFLNKKFGFAKFVGKQNAEIYQSSGLLGFILIPNTDKISYIKGGELLQSIWLNSTDLGLGFQPVTGLFFLNERIKIFGDEPISKENSLEISKAYGNLKELMNIKNSDIILTSFRIGKSKESSGRSSRLKPNIILK